MFVAARFTVRFGLFACFTSVACRGGFALAIRGAAPSARAKDRPNGHCNRCGRRRSLAPGLPVAGIRNTPKIIYAGRRFGANPTTASREGEKRRQQSAIASCFDALEYSTLCPCCAHDTFGRAATKPQPHVRVGTLNLPSCKPRRKLLRQVKRTQLAAVFGVKRTVVYARLESFACFPRQHEAASANHEYTT